MSRSRPNRSAKLEDEADVVYTIATPFQTSDAKILLLDRDEDGVEVIVGNIPTPAKHDLDRNYPGNLEDEETMRTHAAAKWIITETTNIFSDYDWKTSSYKTNNPNYHLRDIYFTCERGEVDDAVMTAKKFLTALEEKSLQHAQEFDTIRQSPREDLEE
jgi:hypothetical protein